MLYGLCNGWISEGTTLTEASSGSTAVSEAFFARLLGLPFVAAATTGLKGGGCTGTALWGSLREIARMNAADETGSLVTLLCDGGERYAHTYYDDGWLAAQGIDVRPWTATLESFVATGSWVEPGR